MTNNNTPTMQSNGVITMEIQQFSEFARKEEDEDMFSKPVNIQGLPWKIAAGPRKPVHYFPRGFSPPKCLGFYLVCNAGNEDPNWRCHASINLKVLAQKEGKEDFVREYQHVFHANENAGGYSRFMALEYLMDPESDWYNRSADLIVLSVDIKANIPYGNIPYGIEMQCSENMGNLIGQGDQYSDCILAAEGKEFKVYKGILASQSPVFAAMFHQNNGMIEAQNGIVQIVDIRPEVLEQMLRFIYTGTKPKMENIILELLIAAERYQIDQLKIICECELAISLNIENACELLIFAEQHSASILKSIAIEYISNPLHANEVTKTESWKMLVQGNYGELLDKIVKTIIKKNE